MGGGDTVLGLVGSLRSFGGIAEVFGSMLSGRASNMLSFGVFLGWCLCGASLYCWREPRFFSLYVVFVAVRWRCDGECASLVCGF